MEKGLFSPIADISNQQEYQETLFTLRAEFWNPYQEHEDIRWIH